MQPAPFWSTKWVTMPNRAHKTTGILSSIVITFLGERSLVASPFLWFVACGLFFGLWLVAFSLVCGLWPFFLWFVACGLFFGL